MYKKITITLTGEFDNDLTEEEIIGHIQNEVEELEMAANAYGYNITLEDSDAFYYQLQ